MEDSLKCQITPSLNIVKTKNYEALKWSWHKLVKVYTCLPDHVPSVRNLKVFIGGNFEDPIKDRFMNVLVTKLQLCLVQGVGP